MAALPNFFAIGDVHGCAEELRALIRKLPLERDSTILFLGDYVDRGPDSKGVIDTILDLSQIYRVIALCGNHEAMFSKYLSNPKDASVTSNFILNGGSTTLASYSADGVTFEVPNPHRQFLQRLQLFHSTESHFFVHAGIPPEFDFDKLDKIDPKTAEQMLWIRSVFLDSQAHWPKIVVHGHTPVTFPDVRPNRVNLDTGCVFGHSLTAMNFTDGSIYFVKRDETVAPRFLIQPHVTGQPRAQRFVGEIGVEIERGGERFSFSTINFNEFGVLIFPNPGMPTVNLSIGEKVQGKIFPGHPNVFTFTGVVMRTDPGKNGMGFGIKFDTLVNDYEAP